MRNLLEDRWWEDHEDLCCEDREDSDCEDHEDLSSEDCEDQCSKTAILVGLLVVSRTVDICIYIFYIVYIVG